MTEIKSTSIEIIHWQKDPLGVTKCQLEQIIAISWYAYLYISYIPLVTNFNLHYRLLFIQCTFEAANSFSAEYVLSSKIEYLLSFLTMGKRSKKNNRVTIMCVIVRCMCTFVCVCACVCLHNNMYMRNRERHAFTLLVVSNFPLWESHDSFSTELVDEDQYIAVSNFPSWESHDSFFTELVDEDQ